MRASLRSPPCADPSYNTQERATHLLLNTRHAPAHLKPFLPWTLARTWASNWALSCMNRPMISISDVNGIQFVKSYLTDEEKHEWWKRVITDQELKGRIISWLKVHVWQSLMIWYLIWFHRRDSTKSINRLYHMILLSRWGRPDAMESYMFTFPVKSSQHFKDLSEEGITQEDQKLHMLLNRTCI